VCVCLSTYESNTGQWIIKVKLDTKAQITRSHPEMVGDVTCDLEHVSILPAPIDTLHIKPSVFMASLFMFGKFVYV